VLLPLLILIVAALLVLFLVLAPLWIVRILARILGALFLSPLILAFLPLLGILLFISLSLIGLGSRHCVPPS
jgi:hypothetical protein